MKKGFRKAFTTPNMTLDAVPRLLSAAELLHIGGGASGNPSPGSNLPLAFAPDGKRCMDTSWE